MTPLHLMLAHYWALPFTLALLARDRRALAAMAVAATPALIWFNLRGDARLATACVIALGIAVSLSLGRAMRAVLAELAPKARTRAITGMVVLGGIALLPGSAAKAVAALAHVATVKVHHWDARMPPSTCLARRYPVAVAGAVYRLPAASVITVRTPRRSFHFQYAGSLRQACEQADRAKAPIHATDLNFDFSIPVPAAFCQAATGAWESQLCKGATRQHAFPAMVNLYAPEEYDRQRLMPPPTYGAFVDAQRKAAAAGHPLLPQAEGVFERYASGYWVARTGAWKNDAGEPYTLRCQPMDTPGVLSCETTYRLRSGPQITYRFSAPERALETAARAVDAALHGMLAEFSAPAPALPPHAATEPTRE